MEFLLQEVQDAQTLIEQVAVALENEASVLLVLPEAGRTIVMLDA